MAFSPDGARIAASEDRSLADGLSHARALLESGLGRSVEDVAVSGTDGADTVSVEARGRPPRPYPLHQGGEGAEARVKQAFCATKKMCNYPGPEREGVKNTMKIQPWHS